MKKKDLFVMIVKLFGLYSGIISLFAFLPQQVPLILMEDNNAYFITLLVSLAIVGLFLVLIFKAGSIVTFLKLEDGFTTDEFNMTSINANDLIRIASIVIGGLLIVDNLPHLVSNVIYEYVTKDDGYTRMTRADFAWASSALSIIIGYLLVTRNELVGKFASRAKVKEDSK